jgi:hypothetical protein
MYFNFSVEDLIEKGDVMKLTAAFFFLNFFAATQDIAVDGWALTMLSKENCSLASTCNSVGQTAGYFMGYVVFLGKLIIQKTWTFYSKSWDLNISVIDLNFYFNYGNFQVRIYKTY